MERMADADRIPAIEGVDDLVAAFDALAARRPPGDPPIPVLLVRGDRADGLVLGLGERLRSGGGEATVPHVVVAARRRREPSDDIAFLDQLANDICRSAPAGMGRIGLPTYWLVRDVLDTPIHRRSVAEQRRELRDRLYARHRDDRPAIDWLVRLATADNPNRLLQAVQALLQPVAVDVPRLVFGRRLARSRRLRWFVDQIARVTGRPHDDVLGAALAVTREGPERGNATLVHRLLVLALRRDVDAAFRSSPVSWQRRRRVSPLVVLVDDLDPGAAAHRFVDTLVAVAGDVPRGSLLVVAGLAAGADLPPSMGADARPLTPERAAAALAPLIDRGRALDAEALVVTTGDGDADDDERAASWLAVNQKVQPSRAHLPVLVPALTIVVAMLVVVLVPFALWSVVMGGGSGDDACPGITRSASGEWIGLGDGTADCTFFPDPRNEVEEDHQEVERQIAAENDRVVAAGPPYTTTVFVSPVTRPEGPERRGQTGLPQLRGVALAQAELNRRAADSQTDMPVRVLLANPGDRFVYGPQVARQINAEARRDPTLVGVVGIAQSRGASREAVGILADEGLPVVAGPVTGDAMTGSSAYYYQVSPQNERVARVLVAFATTAADDRLSATRAVIVKDHSDEYSQNLAGDIRRSFDAEGTIVRTFSYPIEDASEEMPEPDPANQEVRVSSHRQLAQDVCTALEGDPAAVVFFASRAQQLPGMLNSMVNEPACRGPVTVVAGTDITKLVQDPDVDLGRYPDVRLFYGAFASPILQESPVAGRFVGDYTDAYGSTDIAVEMSDPALTYDALFAMQVAANLVSEAKVTLSPGTVAAKLDGGEVSFNGATGYIHFDGDLEVNRVPEDKPVLVLEATPEPSAPLLVCGRLAESVERTTWGPDGFPCPRDQR